YQTKAVRCKPSARASAERGERGSMSEARTGRLVAAKQNARRRSWISRRAWAGLKPAPTERRTAHPGYESCAAAAPPRTVVNSRRFIRSPHRRGERFSAGFRYKQGVLNRQRTLPTRPYRCIVPWLILYKAKLS